MWPRVILTLLLAAAYSAVNAFYLPNATLLAGQTAGAQFLPSDGAYLQTSYVFSAIHGTGLIITAVGLLLLFLIWIGPITRAFTDTSKLMIAALILVGASSYDARAYYDQKDWAETYFVLTNESAFYVPDVGDNKSSQAAFGSLAYYEQNKIPAKRFSIPHIKLENSGAWSNYYVPAGRLIIVDRTPQSREWVKAAHRGTSKNDQSFPCQSKEGLDITVGIAIGVSVSETDAPKFLYRFGVEPPQGDRSRPEVVFQSVFYGRSLSTVTDGPVRNKVQSVVCDEFTAKTLDEANAQAPTLMKSIETKAKAYLTDYGVTLDYIGWADTFEFGEKVQGAIDRKYVSVKEAEIAALMAPHTATLQALSTAEATRTIADGLAKGKVNLPTSLSIMDFGWLKDMFSVATGSANKTERPVPTAPAAK